MQQTIPLASIYQFTSSGHGDVMLPALEATSGGCFALDLGIALAIVVDTQTGTLVSTISLSQWD